MFPPQIHIIQDLPTTVSKAAVSFCPCQMFQAILRDRQMCPVEQSPLVLVPLSLADPNNLTEQLGNAGTVSWLG